VSPSIKRSNNSETAPQPKKRKHTAADKFVSNSLRQQPRQIGQKTVLSSFANCSQRTCTIHPTTEKHLRYHVLIPRGYAFSIEVLSALAVISTAR
jgi:hypothetical protein